MVPAIRNILGGFLFSGDDVYKRAGVLSGGERTRLAVARMLLRPSNTLLLDEPTNHLDLDSKDVLLDALADYGGTLIFVSHDRYFVERLATKIIEIGHGTAVVYPGTYKEFLWHKEHCRRGAARAIAGRPDRTRRRKDSAGGQKRASRRAGRRHARRRGPLIRRRSSPHRATRRSALTPKRANESARPERARREIDALETRIAECRAGDPRASSRRWPRPGSTTTGRPPSR